MIKILIIITFSAQLLLAQSINISYNYDRIDRMTAVSYSSGQEIDYGYDDAGNIVSVSHSGGAESLEVVTSYPTDLNGGDVVVGDVLNYTITATNTGTDTLNNVVVESSLTTPNSITCTALEADATCVLDGNYTVTQTDVNNEGITNLGTAHSDEIAEVVDSKFIGLSEPFVDPGTTRTIKIYNEYDENGNFVRTVNTFYLSGTNDENIIIESGTVIVDGSTTITGHLYHKAGTLKVNNGSLIVKGDLEVSGYNTFFEMTNANDYVLVESDAIFDGAPYARKGQNPKAYLTNEVLEVKGDFTQKNSYHINWYGTYYCNRSSFMANGEHKVILSGNGKQEVNFQSSGTSTDHSHFNVLEINNSSNEGVVFTTTIYIIYDLTATNCVSPLDLTNVTVNGATNLSATCDATTDSDGDGIPDYLDPNNYDGPLADYDNDGLLNKDDLDDDGDSILDAQDTNPYDPNDPVYNGDVYTDGDGLVDGIDPDDDNDGMSDAYEDAHGLDRTDALDADDDADEDGFTNKEEYDAGTDPNDPDDMPVANNTDFNPAVIMYLLH